MIEMMVTLAIIGMAMTVAPAIISGLDGSRLRAASDDLVAKLREVHSQAQRQGVATERALDLNRRGYATSTEPGFHPLPVVVDAIEVTPNYLKGPNDIVRIRFLTDGTATPLRISLRHGGTSTAIAVDWLTGRVRHDK